MEFFDLMEGINYQGFSVGTEIREVVCDSRQVHAGSVFVAIRGTYSDGHDRAVDALEAGAAFVVLERDMGLPLQIVVENTRQVYAQMCANLYDRPSEKLHLIGVTGTNGKTTVTTIIWQMLSALGIKTGLIGTAGNQIGDMTLPARYTTPEASSLQAMLSKMLKAKCKYAILEVSSHAMDQYRLEGCHFETAIFTNLTQDHLDYHKTMESYFEAKSKLFDQAERAIINGDDPYGRKLLQKLKDQGKHPISYGVEAKENYKAEEIVEKVSGVNFLLCHGDEKQGACFAMPGRFSASNALAAVACLVEMGIPLEEATTALEKCTGVKGRAEVISQNLGLPYTIIRDYAHSDDGLLKILSAFRSFVKGKLIVVFGAPGERDETKRSKMGNAVGQYADYAFVASDNPRSEDEQKIALQVSEGLKETGAPYEICLDRYVAIQRAMSMAKADDLLLLAGKGHEEYQVLSYGTLAFDEKEIVKIIAQEGAGKSDTMGN